MKREIRQAIKKAIEESNLNGYSWKITNNGLIWSYCDVEFVFNEKAEKDILTITDKYENVKITVWYSEMEKYADCKTLLDAYYLATKRCISQANYLY